MGKTMTNARGCNVIRMKDATLLVEKTVRLRRKEKEIAAELKAVKDELLEFAVAKEMDHFTASDGSVVRVINTTKRKIDVMKVYNRIKEIFNGKARTKAIEACFNVSLENADKFLSELWVDENVDSKTESSYIKIDLN